MQKLCFFFASLLTFQTLFAQNNPREVFNFDQGWELYRVSEYHETKVVNEKKFSTDTTWYSQFNYEHISNRNEPVDSMVKNEIDEGVHGYENEYPEIQSLKWEKVTLPCPVRYEEVLNPGKNQFVGICYYRKKFTIPPGIRNKRLSVKFEGVMQVATVWINGRFVMQHQGGYLPFVVPLNDYIRPGSQNEIIIRVDNRDNPNTPPGKPLAGLGFLYWSGIYRDAWLIATGNVHITDPVSANTIAGGGIFVRYKDISSGSATVIIKTQVKNNFVRPENGLLINQVLTDNRGNIVRQSRSSSFALNARDEKEITQQLAVDNPELWSPDDPYLYRLTTQVLKQGRLLDQFSQHIGIRSLSYTRQKGFRLNGKPLRIVGTNRHQDHPFIGNALSNEEQYRDLKRIKEAGMNFVRLAHYPQDPSVFDICDSLGLMVADPIPGWQFFNKNDIFKERVFRDIRETIRRDRNHPSVIMWEMSLNESYPPDSFRVASAQVAHTEYPGNQFFTSGDIYGSVKTTWDVPYNGWEEPFGRPQNVQPDQPGFVREYGHFEFGGSHSTTNANRSEGENALLQNAWNMQWEHNLLQSNAYYPWTIGDAQWAFFDGFEAYHNPSSTDWGICDVFRIPKFSYYFYRSQMQPYAKIHAAENKPMVFIANWWIPGDTSSKVVIYSNCDEVALYLNNKLIKKQKPDNGPDSPYGDWYKGGHSFDGGNCRSLQHPPFTFRHIIFRPGTLKAMGYIKGKPVASCIVRTPHTPVSLQLKVNFVEKPLVANGADAVFVYVSLKDKNGATDVLDDNTQIRLETSGHAVIVSPPVATVRAGIASFMIRANDKDGLIKLKAHTINTKVVLNTSLGFNSVPAKDALKL